MLAATRFAALGAIVAVVLAGSLPAHAAELWSEVSPGMTPAEVKAAFPAATSDDANSDDSDPDGHSMITPAVTLVGLPSDVTFHFHKNALDGVAAVVGGARVPLTTDQALSVVSTLKQELGITACERTNAMMEACAGTIGRFRVLIVTMEVPRTGAASIASVTLGLTDAGSQTRSP